MRFDDTNKPTLTGKCSPISTPPVSVPVLVWHALQKLSVISWPRRICSGVPSTFMTSVGALRE